MGYDKPDLGFVVHVGAPPSPVSYYQQVGRAGRAIDHAHAVLLPSRSDEGVWDYFATATIPRPAEVERVLGTLSDAGEAMSVPGLEAQTGVRRGRVELMLKQLAVDEIVERVDSGWVATGREWSHDAEHYEGVVAVRRREAEIMRDYIGGRSCLMELLQRSLDDPHAEPCGRCSVCRGALGDGLRDRPATETVRTVAGVLRGHVQVLEPRKMWPGGSFGTRGRIQPDEAADEGRVLIHADAPEWGEAIAAMRSGDAAADEEVRDAAVRILAQWSRSWSARPDTVVAVAAAGRPLLVGSLADHLASVGRLERVDLPVERGAGDDLSSADEAGWWRDALGPAVADAAAEVAGRAVLLVVDATSSGWPVTVAAAHLRRAGASHVLPFVVHRTV
jgi:ATP-dependent DNA helicase RecQ